MTNEEILIQLVLELSGDNCSICDMMHEDYNQYDWCEDNCGKNGGAECSACVKRLVLLKKDTLRENSKQSLIERIDEIRANSVTDKDFKKVWGKSIDESVNELMEKFNKMEEKQIQQAADNYIGHPYEVDEGYDTSGMRRAFIAGAEWKDQQFKEYLENTIKSYKCRGKEFFVSEIKVLEKIINKLFKED